MTFYKGWRSVVLVCCVVSGMSLAGSLQLVSAGTTKAEKPSQVQRGQPTPMPHSNVYVVPNGKRTGAKSQVRQSARTDQKKRNKPHRTKLDQKGTNLARHRASREIQSLSYHGILEQPKRYDPSRELRRRKGAALNPDAHELQIEHFQELDRNQDGVLDPLERAVGRLDIERDMNNH